jgi:type I restriction enzyme R subunit/putative DNA methylase
VEDILLERDSTDYRLFEWVIMPNHVHALAEVTAHAPLWKVVKRWKGASATAASRVLGRTGTFWWREYHDRFMRDEGHFHISVAYVRNNPVKERLCRVPEEWRFGSAYWREASE